MKGVPNGAGDLCGAIEWFGIDKSIRPGEGHHFGVFHEKCGDRGKPVFGHEHIGIGDSQELTLGLFAALIACLPDADAGLVNYMICVFFRNFPGLVRGGAVNDNDLKRLVKVLLNKMGEAFFNEPFLIVGR